MQWVWPSSLPYSQRFAAVIDFTKQLARLWGSFAQFGHPVELTHDFLEHVLHPHQDQFNATRGDQSMPYLAGLVAASVFDQAIHDAYGMLHEVDIYQTYNREFMSRDLSFFLSPAESSDVVFDGRFPDDFLIDPPPRQLPVWHLVGGLDPISPGELTGAEPDDGYPVVLTDWIARDGLDCLKIKLRGNDADWDLDRVLRIGQLALDQGVHYLSVDFNCTVQDPEYVNQILDLLKQRPSIDL